MGSIYYSNIKYGGGGDAEWGSISGTLSDQTDLQNALNAKQDELTEGDGIDITNTTIALDLDYLTASRVGFIPSSEKGTNNGVATLGSDGKVPTSQIPSALNNKTTSIELTQSQYDVLPPADKTDSTKLYFIKDTIINKAFNSTSWSGLTNFQGDRIWSDGTNTYYSSGSGEQYKLNGTTWVTQTWSGFSDIYKNEIWSDGTNTYYSSGLDQYKLNGNTWESQTWTTIRYPNGSNIWTDGSNVYHVIGDDTITYYKLNGNNWEQVSFSGVNITDFNASCVWSDGTNTYYSDTYDEARQYKLNGTTWVTQTWIGLTDFDGFRVWHDGEDIYYSQGTQYKLNGTTWEEITFEGMTNLYGEMIWTDGTDIYSSEGTSHYKLVKDKESSLMYKDHDYLGNLANLGADGKVLSSQLPSIGGHDMIPVTNDIATVTALTDGDDNYVINAYTAKRWSNVDTISIFTTASQGTDTIGTWVTDWKTSGASRVGWLWDSDLYGILSDDDIEIEPIYDVANSEVISIYAIRIDDDVDQTINGQTVHGGAIAFKLNNKIRSSGGVKIGINLKHQRTNVKNFTVIS